MQAPITRTDNGTDPHREVAGSCGRGPGDDGYVAVVGIRLRGQVRMTQFNSAGVHLEMGQLAVVEGEQGTDLGEVVQPTARARRSCAIGCMKRARRVAGEDDLRAFQGRATEEDESGAYCRERIRERSLPMKLVRVECGEESRRTVFHFTAEGRVDFRELVKDLAARFHCRVEMRQIGVRDEARALGGYGDCGKALCCSTFLREFAPVSIKMARQQNLSLNPSRISGMCGRLKCCLRYEYNAPGGEMADLAPEEEPFPPAPPGLD